LLFAPGSEGGRVRRFLVSLAMGAAVAAVFEAAAGRDGVIRASIAPSPRPNPTTPAVSAPPPRSDAFDPWVHEPDRRKVAFLFVTETGELPHDHLWARFFAGQDPNLYALHVHVPSAFTFDAANTAAPEVFAGTEVRASSSPFVDDDDAGPRRRSGSTLTRVTKALLRRALLDEDVARFVTVSDSCVPIRTFPELRAYLLDGGQDQGKNVERSFVDSRIDPGLAPKARDALRSLGVPKLAWRKGSSWFALIRPHARLVAEDVKVFDAMLKGCGEEDKNDEIKNDDTNEPLLCVVDDHYVPTLIAFHGKEHHIEVRGVTYQNWWPVTRRRAKRYAVQEARDAVRTIRGKYLSDDPVRDGNKDVVGGSGSRSCGYFRGGGDRAGTRRPCWLIARKFTARAGRRIGKFAATAVGY